jgi:hypothetical protein
VLEQATLGPVAIERHGRIVAYLVPASPPEKRGRSRSTQPPPTWDRHYEARVIELCAKSDFRPSRWLRAGNPDMLAGVAAMMASVEGFDRTRMLALAERLKPGMSTVEVFGQWLAKTPIRAERFLPLLKTRIRTLRTLAAGDPD